MCEGYERNSLPSIGSEGSISSLLTEADPSIRCDGSLSWRLNRLDDCTTNNDQGNLAKETTQSSCAPFKRMISDDSSRTTASIESDHSLSSTVAAGFICISDKGTSEPKLNLRLRERSEPRHRCPLVNGSLTGIARPSRYSTRVNSMATSTLFPQAHLARRFLSSKIAPQSNKSVYVANFNGTNSKPASNCLDSRCVSFSPTMEIHLFERDTLSD